jgi:hypothetical protein
VSHHVIKRAVDDARRLIDAPLLSRLPDHAYLCVMSAFLASREHSSTAVSGRKRRGSERGAISFTSECSGVVYGCCLGSLVAYLRLPTVSVSFTVRQIEAILAPVAACALKTHGVDASVLCAGLASSRMIRSQQTQTNAGCVPPGLHSRNGNPYTMIGLSASIFVLFSILSSSMLGSVENAQLEIDIQWMLSSRSVEQVLATADRLAEHAVPVDGWTAAPAFEVAALDAEHRSIQRAIKAVSAAREFSVRHGLSPCSTFRKTLDWYARAAWPAGELLNERTHTELLARLSTHEYYATEHLACDTASIALPTSDFVPLEQLGCFTERSNRRGLESDSSSVATGSSGVGSGSGSISQCGDDTDYGTVGIEGILDVCIVNK